MRLEREHLLLLAALALIGVGVAAVLPALQSDPTPEPRPRAPPSETVRVQGIAHVGGGDAQAALPLLPLEANDTGVLHGSTEVTLAGSGEARDVRDWHRGCLPADGPGLPASGEDAPLRYLDLGRTNETGPHGGKEPWYAPRHGDPVRAGDLPAGRPVYAAWGAGPDPSAEAPILGLLRMNETALTPAHDPFTEDGVVAFAVRAAPACRVAAVAPDVPPGGSAAVRDAVQDRPRLDWPPDPEVVVDAGSGAVWDPTAAVADLLVRPPEPPSAG